MERQLPSVTCLQSNKDVVQRHFVTQFKYRSAFQLTSVCGARRCANRGSGGTAAGTQEALAFVHRAGGGYEVRPRRFVLHANVPGSNSYAEALYRLRNGQRQLGPIEAGLDNELLSGRVSWIINRPRGRVCSGNDLGAEHVAGGAYLPRTGMMVSS